MSSQRRYSPISKYPVYSKEFDRLRMGSEILNPDFRPSVHSILWDKENLKAELIKTLGNYKPLAQAKLEALEIKFKNLQSDCRNQGREIPVEMPNDLLNEKHKVEASIDILTEETEWLSEKLKTIADKAVKETNANMLRYGLQCRSHNHGLHQPIDKLINVMAEIDGQTVSMSPDELLIIWDENSPYNGMSVADYRKLSKIWHQDRLNADAFLLIKLQKEAKEEGRERPFATGRSMNSAVDKAYLPKFPDWAKHYSMSIIEEEEEVPMKRMPKYKNSRVK